MKTLLLLFVFCALSCAMFLGCASAPETRRPLVISPMGDSLTQGNAWTGGGVSVCYRKALASGLWAAGYAPRFVGAHETNSKDVIIPGCTAHSGFSGYVIQEGHGRGAFSKIGLDCLAKAADAQVVLLLIGTNDLDIHPRQDAAAGEEVFGWWTALMKRYLAAHPEMWFIVATVPNQNPDAGGRCKASIDAFNAALRNLFDTRSETLVLPGDPNSVTCATGTLGERGRALFGAEARIVLADINRATPAGKTYFSTDRLHPTQPGQDRWAAVWQHALEVLVVPNLAPSL